MPQASKTIVCDIDGTLCNDHLRRKNYLTRKPDWTAYLSHCYPAQCEEETVALVRDYISRGYRVIFVTGRPEALRLQTQWFLTGLGLKVGEGDLMMRDNQNSEDEIALKTRFMKKILESCDVIAALDCRSAVREAYKSLGVRSFGPPRDIDYPSYCLPALPLNEKVEIFGPRIDFRRRADAYCSDLFGEVRWRSLRYELLEIFNRQPTPPKFIVRSIDGNPRFFSRDLLTRVQTTFVDSPDGKPLTFTWDSNSTFADDKPIKREGSLFYYADVWEPGCGEHKAIGLDGRTVTCSYSKYGWTHPIAGFFAEEDEIVKRKENHHVDYVPVFVTDPAGRLPAVDVTPQAEQILRRIALVVEDGRFTFEAFATNITDPKTGEKYPAFAAKTGEHWIRKLERGHYLKTSGGRFWKNYNIRTTERFASALQRLGIEL